MAKLAKKIRIEEYDVINNEFKLTFQLATTDQVRFISTFNSSRILELNHDTVTVLNLLGISEFYTRVIIDEIFDWISKPRKALGGQSHIDNMQSRFEVVDRMEREQRGQAEAQRIVMEAPALDWAMDAVSELEAAHADRAQPVADEVFDFTDFLSEIESQLAVQKVVAAQQTDEPAQVEVPSDWEIAKPDDRPSLLVDALNAVLPRLVSDVGANVGYLFELQPLDFDERNLKDAFRRTFEDAFKIVPSDRGSSRKPVSKPIAAIDSAVDEIHTHFIRFMTPSSMREHEFLRSIVREEIEKVVSTAI